MNNTDFSQNISPRPSQILRLTNVFQSLHKQRSSLAVNTIFKNNGNFVVIDSYNRIIEYKDGSLFYAFNASNFSTLVQVDNVYYTFDELNNKLVMYDENWYWHIIDGVNFEARPMIIFKDQNNDTKFMPFKANKNKNSKLFYHNRQSLYEISRARTTEVTDIVYLEDNYFALSTKEGLELHQFDPELSTNSSMKALKDSNIHFASISYCKETRLLAAVTVCSGLAAYLCLYKFKAGKLQLIYRRNFDYQVGDFYGSPGKLRLEKISNSSMSLFLTSDDDDEVNSLLVANFDCRNRKLKQYKLIEDTGLDSVSGFCVEGRNVFGIDRSGCLFVSPIVG